MFDNFVGRIFLTGVFVALLAAAIYFFVKEENPQPPFEEQEVQKFVFNDIDEIEEDETPPSHAAADIIENENSNFVVPKKLAATPPPFNAPRPSMTLSSIDHIKEKEQVTSHIFIHLSNGLDQQIERKHCDLDEANDVWVFCGNRKLERFEQQILHKTKQLAIDKCNDTFKNQVCPPLDI